MPLLEAKNITHRFDGLCAVDDFNFVLAPHELVGVIGPNGAGKTTLFNLITGVYRATEGTIEFAGEELVGQTPHSINKLGIARTFQNIRLFPAMTCLENVIAGQHLVALRPFFPRLFCLPSAGRQEKEHRRQAMDCLARVGIESKAHFPARALSYGERRRLEIARALASRPRLLLLDEPVAGMRQQEVEQVGSLIQSLAAEGMTILLIEHNMSFVMGLCATITVLNFGRTLVTGNPNQVSRHPEVIEAYLGASENNA